MMQLGPGDFASTSATTGLYVGLVPYEGQSRITSVFGAHELFRQKFPAVQPDGSIKFIDVGPHQGADFVPDNGEPGSGQPVLVLAPGKVTAVGQADPQPAWANYIYIEHQAADEARNVPRILTRYLHFKEPPVLEVGDLVKRGDVIGLTGTTGKSTGPHVHIDLWVDGDRVDPMSLIVSELDLSLMSKQMLAAQADLKVWTQDYEVEFDGLTAVMSLRLDV